MRQDIKVLLYPDPQLRHQAEPIKEITQRVCERAEEMLELMYKYEGLGLAAPQISWPVSLVVMDPTGERSGRRVFINPVITHEEGEIIVDEGCLSLPGVFGKVVRSEKVKVVAFNLEGERIEVEAEGLEARVWQHEADHLEGRLIIDKMTPASRMTNSRRLKELEVLFKEGAVETQTL